MSDLSEADEKSCTADSIPQEKQEYVYIGRQPIYDRRVRVKAYELLFRSSMENRAIVIDDDRATSQTLLNLFVEFDFDSLIGNRRAFVNLTRGYLTGHFPLPLNKDRLVLEVLEDIEMDSELLEHLRRLKEEGYTIALDDFVYHPKLEPLLEIADIIKVELPAIDREELEVHIEKLRRPWNKLLAEKVETHEQFEHCHKLGFEYFQGFFLGRPHVIKGKTLQANRLIMMKLLAKLQDSSVAFSEIEEILQQDVSASYKVLRYINSVYHSLPKKVESLRQALLLLGLEPLRMVVTLITMSELSDKPNDLMIAALIRAKMCELLAAELKVADSQQFFAVGLFSSLDAMMDCPIEEIVKTLPLSDGINNALLNYEGLLGQSLKCTLSYEHTDWEAVECSGLTRGQIYDAFSQAVRWANETSSTLLQGAGGGEK